MNRSMQLSRDRIALEASVGASIQEALLGAFPAMVAEFKGFVGQFMPNTPAVPLPANQQNFLRELSKHSYLDIAPLTAYTPEGLDTTYLRYSNEVMLAAAHASRILSGTMTAYSVFLSQLINNADKKFDTHSFDRAYKELSKERDKMTTEMGKCFKPGGTKVEQSIGAVTQRNADWDHVLQNVYNAGKLINTVDRKMLNKKVAECAELLDVIIKKLERGEFENASKETAHNLAEGAYQIGLELEFFSVTYYRVLALTESVNRTIGHFMSTMANAR